MMGSLGVILAFALTVTTLGWMVFTSLPDAIARRKERASIRADLARDDARYAIQQREHEILDPRPVELWAHGDCRRCYDLARRGLAS